MSRSLSPPWILNYLTEVAVTQGGNLLNAPLFTANKKVQLIKFLTHQLPDDDSWIWVQISDMAYTIPVRFSKAAMEAYSRDLQFGETPVHQLKTAFITIRNFRPMLSRFPVGPANQGMTSKAHIVLDVNAFEVKGALGQEIWGKPMSVEAHKDIKLWADGLREGGGNGNVLKLRKEEAEKAAALAAAAQTTALADTRPTSVRSSIRNTFRPVRPQTSVKASPEAGKDTTTDSHVRVNGHRRNTSSDRKSKFFIVVPSKADILSFLAEADFLNPTEQTGPATEKPKPPSKPLNRRKTPSTPPPKRRSALDFSSPSFSTAPQASQSKSPSPTPESPVIHEERQTTPSDWSPSQKDTQEDLEVEAESDEGQELPGELGIRDEKMEVDADEEAGSGSGEENEEDESENERDELEEAEDEQPESPTRGSPMHVDDEPASPDKSSSHPHLYSSATLPPAAQRPRPSSPFSLPPSHQHRPSQSSQVNDGNGVVLVASSSALPARSRSPSPYSRELANPAVRIFKRCAVDDDSVVGDKGKGRVLVPNSDTSGTTGTTHSQSQSQSQKQKQALELSESQSESQSVWLLQSQVERRGGVLESPGKSQEEDEREGEEHTGESDMEKEKEGDVEEMERKGSQEHPLAQSLEYTSQSQSQEKLTVAPQPAEDEGEAAEEDEDDLVDESPETGDIQQDVQERRLGEKQDVIPDSDITAEESQPHPDDLPSSRAYVPMEEEESTQTETEEDLTEAEDEVMASLERFESEGLGGEMGGEAEGESEDENGREVEGRVGDGFEEVDASVEEEVELRRVSYEDVQTARMVRVDMEEDEDEQIADASPVSYTSSQPRADAKTPLAARHHEIEQREEPGRRRSRHSSTTRSPPLSRTPSLPSEPDVFMDEESFSAHAESASASVRNGRTAVLGKHTKPSSENHANSVSASISTPPMKHRRQSSGVYVNAEAGPSTVSGASKSSSKSPSKKTKARFLFHDPEAWAAPSFQRNANKGKKAETGTSANVVSSRPSLSNASASKGKGKQVSSTILGAQDQGKDVERPDLIQPSDGKRHSSEHRVVEKRKRVAPADESMTSTPNLRPHKKRKQSESPSPPASPPRKRRAVSDRHSISRDVPPAPELAKTDSMTSTVDRIRKIDLKREESLSSKARGSVSRTSVKKIESKVERGKMRQSSSSHGGEELSEDSRPVQPVVRKRRKLGGFKLDLDLDVRDHPGLVTWDVLGDMLLRIQKARERKREQQREQERDRE